MYGLKVKKWRESCRTAYSALFLCKTQKRKKSAGKITYTLDFYRKMDYNTNRGKVKSPHDPGRLPPSGTIYRPDERASSNQREPVYRYYSGLNIDLSSLLMMRFIEGLDFFVVKTL